MVMVIVYDGCGGGFLLLLMREEGRGWRGVWLLIVGVDGGGWDSSIARERESETEREERRGLFLGRIDVWFLACFLFSTMIGRGFLGEGRGACGDETGRYDTGKDERRGGRALRNAQ